MQADACVEKMEKKSNPTKKAYGEEKIIIVLMETPAQVGKSSLQEFVLF